MKKNDKFYGRPLILFDGTTAELNALDAETGMFAYDTTLEAVVFYDGSEWVPVFARSITEDDISDLTHTDSQAFHRTTPSEIHGLTEVTSPQDYDVLLVEEGDTVWTKKHITVETLRDHEPKAHSHTESDITDLDHTDTDAIHGSVAGEIYGLINLPGAHPSDLLLIEDASNAYAKRKILVSTVLGLGATDPTAIHDNIAAEINPLTSVTPATGDIVLIEDASDSWNKKKVTVSSIQNHTPAAHTHTESDITDLDHTDANAIHDNVAGEINALTEKTSLVDDDLFLIEDSEDSYTKKKVSKSNITVMGNFVSLGTPLQSSSFNGDSFSTTSKTKIDLSATFGVPAGVKAVYAFVRINDSASASNNYYACFGPTSASNEGIFVQCLPVNDRHSYSNVIIDCDENGDFYYQISASGTNTFDMWIWIWGYWLPDSVPNGSKFVSLPSVLTSTSFDGDSFSTMASKSKIDLSAVFGVPAGIEAVLLNVAVRDSASATNDTFIGFSPNSTAGSFTCSVDCSGLSNNQFERQQVITSCDSNGDIYYQVTASGSGTLDLYIQVLGYWLPGGNTNGLLYVPLQTPLTSTSWDGDARATTGSPTLLDLGTTFGLPDNIKAIDAEVWVRDSGSAGVSTFVGIYLGPNNSTTGYLSRMFSCNDVSNNVTMRYQSIITCNDDGNVYYNAVATSGTSLDVWIQIWGYYI